VEVRVEGIERSLEHGWIASCGAHLSLCRQQSVGSDQKEKKKKKTKRKKKRKKAKPPFLKKLSFGCTNACSIHPL
jgi:hypothetical protein